MTLEELEFLQRYPKVPESLALTMFRQLKCGQEVKESAARAVKDGIVGRWVPTVQPEE